MTTKGDVLVARAADRGEAEALAATLCLGLLAAIERGALTLDDAEARLFSPYTMRVLRAIGARDEVVDCIHRGTELGDIGELLPARLAATIAELREAALVVLREARGREPSPHWLSTDTPLPPLEEYPEDD